MRRILKVNKMRMLNVSSSAMPVWSLNTFSMIKVSLLTRDREQQAGLCCGGWKRMDVGFSLTFSCTDAKCFLSR